MANVAITNQPGTQTLVCSLNGHRDWSTGIFSCFSDLKSCIMGTFCQPCVVCDISSRTGEYPCMPYFIPYPAGMFALRARIRTLGGIQGSICEDYITVSCCHNCAICQMQRELDAMGL